jgi:hypothetical protein
LKFWNQPMQSGGFLFFQRPAEQELEVLTLQYVRMCVSAWVWICRWSLWIWQHLQHRLRSGHCGAQFGSLQQWSQLWSLLSAHLRGFPVVPRRKSWRDYSYRYYLVSVVYTSMEQ